MTARKTDISGLPDWPRGLSLEQAAAYVGVSPGKFKEEVAEGLWPKPWKRGRRLIWDRMALDKVFDQRSKLTARSGADIVRERERRHGNGEVDARSPR